MNRHENHSDVLTICEKCGSQGKFKERTRMETYSIHYVETVDVYVCEKCGHTWWVGIERELS